MNTREERFEFFKFSHLIIVVAYSIFVAMHVIISFLLGWEKWILLPILAGLMVCWFLHIKAILTDTQRSWVYAGIMMANYFVYGTHITSTFDHIVIMISLLLLYTLTSQKGLIYLGQIVYYVTMTYDIYQLYQNGTTFDALLICRITMNYSIITMIGWMCRLTIVKWDQVLIDSAEQIEQLTVSTNRLNDFLANVSHEIRTPVNAIIGLTSICIDKTEDKEMKTDMSSVRSAGKRIADQISDILDYSEIDRGTIVTNYEDFMLSSAMNDIMTDIRENVPDDMDLVVDIDPDIPAVLNTDVTKLKKIIKALVSNGLKYTKAGGVCLKISAVKREYGINLYLDVTDTGIGMTPEEIEHVYDRFYQSDSGRSRSGSGLGLGLGIVHGFVSLLGGFMTIRSKVGEGTEVHVSIPMSVTDDNSCMSVNNPEKIHVASFFNFENLSTPAVRDFYTHQAKNLARGLRVRIFRISDGKDLYKVDDSVTHLFVGENEYLTNRDAIEKIAENCVVTVVYYHELNLPSNSRVKLMQMPFYSFPIVSILNTSSEVKPVGSKMVVSGIQALIVDDEPMNLIVASSIFKRYGLKVSTAKSGPESIQMCHDNVYDIVFMDHMMAGMDGVEAMKKIKTDLHGKNHDTPMVALTANAMSSAKQMFLSEGFDGFVSKPIVLEELERTLKRLLPKNSISYISEGEEVSVADDEVFEFGPEAAENTEADASAKSCDPPDVFEKLEAAGIDTAAGLGYFDGDKDFYMELVVQFTEELSNKIDNLNKFYAAEDWGNYEIIIHATKSSCKMIGENVISDEAYKLEQAAHNKDAGYITDNHNRVLKRITLLKEALTKLLGNHLPASDEVMEFGSDSDSDEVFEFGPESGDDEVFEFDAKEGE
ncbi:MAG: response regulator [Lachnospiraceae bacterium]|nr:response regulator [Lachnospiraceae bacterium]